MAQSGHAHWEVLAAALGVLGLEGQSVMTKRKSRPPKPEILVAAIESIGQTYYLSEMSEEVRRVDDEPILDVVGRIEHLDRTRSQYLGCRVEISLLCARPFGEKPPTSTGKPFLMSVQLRKRGCSLAAYLPADAF
jgi:hypothetical protein